MNVDLVVGNWLQGNGENDFFKPNKISHGLAAAAASAQQLWEQAALT